MKKFIKLYKRQRRHREFSRRYKYSYAFVGMGNHSLANLYPVLDHLAVPLKYVVTASSRSADILNHSSGKYRAVCDLQTVLSDKNIEGIFICTDPRHHYDLCKLALQHKKVFL
ncbi:MAG: Gfo/Idh/MocA family oxidoreductase [Bacteroides sp.]|nr:Gfo/Idh/MocA family oxidoreductase [Bacteroides sp.]